jgi:8-oxo-dGTP diphosphatase
MSNTRSKKYVYAFPRPAVTVDALIVTREKRPRVLLIRRKHSPFAGKWALPGGFVDENEPLETAARRELLEETGIRIKQLDQLAAFGDPPPETRGWTISIVFMGRAEATALRPYAADDAAGVGWHPLDRLPPLAFDHAAILKLARRKLRDSV